MSIVCVVRGVCMLQPVCVLQSVCCTVCSHCCPTCTFLRILQLSTVADKVSTYGSTDGISARMLKAVASSIAPSVTKLFSLSIASACLLSNHVENG